MVTFPECSFAVKSISTDTLVPRIKAHGSDGQGVTVIELMCPVTEPQSLNVFIALIVDRVPKKTKTFNAFL